MNNTFLSDFIMITNFKTIAFITVLNNYIIWCKHLWLKRKVKIFN